MSGRNRPEYADEPLPIHGAEICDKCIVYTDILSEARRINSKLDDVPITFVSEAEV